MEQLDFLSGMQVAFAEAEKAFIKGEVPVGAAIFEGGKMLSAAHNLKESSGMATAHAEILAIEKACELKGDWRLENTILFATAEPCLMCAGAIIQARIPLVIFGVSEPKFGAVVSNIDAFNVLSYNHHPEFKGGVMADEIQALMVKFFKELRNKKKA